MPLSKVPLQLSWRPLQVLKGCNKVSPWSLLFSRLNSPKSLSLSSQERCSGPLVIFVASSGPSLTGPCLSRVEGSRAGRRTPGGVSPERSRRADTGGRFRASSTLSHSSHRNGNCKLDSHRDSLKTFSTAILESDTSNRMKPQVVMHPTHR